jgi:HSP20 family protein
MRDLLQMQDKMNRLFEDALSKSVGHESGGSLASEGWKPPLDMFEEADRYVLRADLPGVASTDVEIRVEDGTLQVRGERRADADVSREAYLRVERPHGRFAVQVSLPPSVDAQNVQALHRNGVIEIVLPKRREEPPSRVEISDG